MKITIKEKDKETVFNVAPASEVIISASEDKGEESPSIWDRVEKDEMYYWMSKDFEIAQEAETYHSIDDRHYLNSNYCREKRPLELRAKRQSLTNRMEVYRDKNDKEFPKNLFIIYSKHTKTCVVCHGHYPENINNIYFSSLEKAREAIKVFGEEFKALMCEIHAESYAKD